MVPKVTLLELVALVNDYAETESELIAVVVDMVNGGKVELGGTFRGCRFALEGVATVGA